LREYRRAQLRSPDALPSRRAQAWFRKRVSKVVNREERVADGAGISDRSGADELRGIVDELQPLLEQLTGSPKLKLADHPSIPNVPGVYLFSEGPNPIYVGQSRSLHQRLRQREESFEDEDSSSLVFNLALHQAAEQGLDTTGTRSQIAARPGFSVLLEAARRRVEDMSVQFVEVGDPVTRTIFEVYAARILATDELSP
jgi:hypothetical protein